MRVRVGVVVLILSALAAFAQSEARTPKQVVEEYCRLDAGGALTSSDGWPTISPLFVWPDAPGWDTFTVIRGYTVGDAKVQGDTAVVPVEYELIGVLDSTPRFRPAKAKKVMVPFHLVHNNKHWVLDSDGNPDHEESSGPAAWRIDDPQNEPHVGRDHALKMAHDFLEKAADPAEKRNAEAALKALQAAE